MKIDLADATSVIAILALILLAIYLAPDIPDQMPVSQSSDQIPADYAGRLWGMTMLVGLPAAAFGLLKLLPRISPHGFRIERFQHAYDVIVMAVTLSLTIISAMVLLAAAGESVPLGAMRSIVLGGLFIVLGNYCGKMRRNFFAGIRTPWTLASEEVWARTHRVGGWLFVLAGLAVLATALRPAYFLPVLVAAVGAAAVISVGYSLVLYWRLYGFSASPD